MRVWCLCVLVGATSLACAQDVFPDIPQSQPYLRLMAMPGVELADLKGRSGPQQLGLVASKSLKHIQERVGLALQIREELALFPKGSPAYRTSAAEREPLLRQLREWEERRVLAELRDIFGNLREYPYSARRMAECEDTSRNLKLALSAPSLEQLYVPAKWGPDDNFPDLPPTYAVRKSLTGLKAAGLLLVPWPGRRHEQPSVVDIRTYAESAIEQGDSILSNVFRVFRVINDPRTPGEVSAVKDMARLYYQAYHAFSQYEPVADLAPRFEAIGRKLAWMDVPSDRQLRDPFSDVPAGHWASNATTELRRQGIMVGYGGNRFLPPPR